MEKLEAERNRERMAEAAAIQRARMGQMQQQHRGGGAFRGRGGYSGSAAGPLGAGIGRGGMPKRGGRGGFGGGRFDGGGRSRDSPASRHSIVRSRSVTTVPSEGPGQPSVDYSSDESDSAIRVSIDNIALDDDEEEDLATDAKGKGKAAARPRNRGLRPIRVERHEHEERVISVSTEASSSAAAELRRQAQEKEGGADNELFVPAEEEEEKPRIKEEPTEEDVSMADVPPADELGDLGGLPPPPTKVREQTKMEKKVQEQKEQPKAEDPRSRLRTKEEIEEYDRFVQDRETMKNLLVAEESDHVDGLRPTAAGEEEEKKDPEAAAAKEEEEASKDKLAGQLFLIQFPPLTPNLAVPGTVTTTADDTSGGQAATTQSSARPDMPRVKQEDTTEGKEEDVVMVDGTGLPPAPKLMTATQGAQIPAGRVGRLHVHASGRVTMDWGGISFELNRGTDVDFLQEAVVVSPSSAVEDGEGQEGNDRRIWAMGQLSGKFVAQPDWSKLL